MAKALFHKTQRVFVKPVGTWALVEQVIPHWVKGVDQPLRVTYDVGLGREFKAEELVSENEMRQSSPTAEDDDFLYENWRIHRAPARWQGAEANPSHPYPGTYPVIFTDEQDWGGWRVPGAEYDRDPTRIEHQARMVVNAPDMVRIIKAIADVATDQPENCPGDIIAIAKRCSAILRHVYEVTDDLDTDMVAAE